MKSILNLLQGNNMRKLVVIAMFIMTGFVCFGVGHALDATTPVAPGGEVLMLASLGSPSGLMVESEEMSSEALGLVTGKGLPKQAGSEWLSKIILWDEIDPKKAAADSMTNDQTIIVLRASGMRSGSNW
jgi:hypothetical protein